MEGKAVSVTVASGGRGTDKNQIRCYMCNKKGHIALFGGLRSGKIMNTSKVTRNKNRGSEMQSL